MQVFYCKVINICKIYRKSSTNFASLKKHTKIYFDFFGYDTASFVRCEVCGAAANDIHHIQARGMGGSKTADRIENLMALCRKHHEMYGDRKQWKDWLQKVHDLKMNERG